MQHRASNVLLFTALLVLCLASGWAAGQPDAAGAPEPPPPGTLNSTFSQQQGMLTFCVANWEPISMCSNLTTNPANFTGHDVEMLRDAAQVLGLKEGLDFQFRCVNFSQMINALMVPGSNCSASASSITITTEREAAGIQFTYPYFKSSLGILVKADKPLGTGWGFIRPFSWTLWLALFLTLVAFPPIIFVIEFLSLRKRIHRDDVVPGIVESSWRSAITLMLFDAMSVTSHGARVAVLCFCFLALLVTSTYTANLAAFVTVSTISSRITSVADLRGRAVGTSPIYIDRLHKYGIQGIPYPFNTGSDYLYWRDLVSSGELAALVRDMPALQWLTNTAPNCDVVTLPDGLEAFDYGVAFHVNASDALVAEWSRAILRLQEDNTLSDLKNTWIASTTSGCQATAQLNKNAQSVSFSDLYGLWIILSAGVGAGLLTMLGQRWVRRMRKHHGDGGSGAGASMGPLPSRRPRHLVSTVRTMCRRGKRHPGDGSSEGSGARKGGGQQNAREGSFKPQPSAELPDGASGSWDMESQASGSPARDAPALTMAAVAAAAVAEAAAASQKRVRAVQPPAAQQQTPPASPQPEADPSRASALQAVESIYAAHRWKSLLRTPSNGR